MRDRRDQAGYTGAGGTMDGLNVARPRAETYRVEDLVADARRGRVRVPTFQRPLRWDAKDVQALFDSVYRGFPIGSLLLWRRPEPVPDGPVQLGPLVIERPDRDDVRWLVDGQQRVTALVAGLSGDRPKDPAWDVWFDPDKHRFHTRPRGQVVSSWVPVPMLLDAAQLGEFLLEWRPGLEVRERRRTLLDAGKRIREYPIPAYIIESHDDSALREVFRRVNRQGKRLDETHVFDALVSSADHKPLREVSGTLASIGWGEIDETTLLWSVHAMLGLDPTRSLDRQPEGTEARLGPVADRLLGVFTRAVAFLRVDGGIPHVTTLPHAKHVLVTLARWFYTFPDPSDRARRLLTRWVWRNAISGRHASDYVFLRAALSAIDKAEDEEEAAQRLLALVPSLPPKWALPVSRFRRDANEHRLGLLGLATLEPRSLETGDLLDVSRVLDAPKPGLEKVTADDDGWPDLANRIIHPRGTSARDLLIAAARRYPDSSLVMTSHAFDAQAVASLAARDFGPGLLRRKQLIEAVVEDVVASRAEWGHDDGPSVRTLFRRVG